MASGGASPGKRDYEEIINDAKFKEWFFRGDNSEKFIVALNDFSFKKRNLKGTFVRLEKYPAHIYGVVINENGQSERKFWTELHRLGLKLVKVGFTQQEVIKGCGNRMETIEKEIKKNLGFESSTIFCLIIDFTTTSPFRDEENDIRRKVGIPLDKDSAKRLNLPTPTEWVLTSQKYIFSLKQRVKEVKQDCIKKMYTTNVIGPCKTKKLKELVQKIDPRCVELQEGKIVYHDEQDQDSLFTKLTTRVQQLFSGSYTTAGEQENETRNVVSGTWYPNMGCASPDGVNCESTTYKPNLKDWFSRADNLNDMIIARNDFSFKENKGPFVRLEKSPSQIYAVVINDDGQHKHQFWKELYRLGLKLVKIGFTQHETIKGSGNPMEIIQEQIKRELRFESSLIFCLIIDFTAMTSFREVEEDIRSKVGIKLDKKFAKWLKLPIPTDWVLTSQGIIYSLTNRIQEKEEQCTNNKTIHTTKDMEPCDLQSIEKLVNKINLSYVRLKDNKIVMGTEEDILVENFKKAL